MTQGWTTDLGQDIPEGINRLHVMRSEETCEIYRNTLRAWEMVLESKAFAKRPQRRHHADCHGRPVPFSKLVEGVGVINSF